LNLLDNAIRHTPTSGGVCVSLNQFEKRCEVVVADTGEGIPVEAQPHIFDRFYRADKARSRSDVNAGANGAGGGGGRGLSMARRDYQARPFRPYRDYLRRHAPAQTILIAERRIFLLRILPSSGKVTATSLPILIKTVRNLCPFSFRSDRLGSGRCFNACFLHQ